MLMRPELEPYWELTIQAQARPISSSDALIFSDEWPKIRKPDRLPRVTQHATLIITLHLCLPKSQGSVGDDAEPSPHFLEHENAI